jgi:hypothetical protein
MNITKALYEFLIATLPAVIVYFIGWAYLFFFLSDFSINITELNFDTTTVFIYAFAPIQIFAKNHWLLTLFGILAAFILFFIVPICLPIHAPTISRGLSRWSGRIPIFAKILFGAIVFVALLIGLLPLLRSAALQKKQEIWSGNANYVLPLFVGDAGQAASASQDLSWRDNFIKSYMLCSDQEALRLIFSDEKVYYLLCKSEENGDEGYVFEVRHEGGLASVRFATLTENLK